MTNSHLHGSTELCLDIISTDPAVNDVLFFNVHRYCIFTYLDTFSLEGIEHSFA